VNSGKGIAAYWESTFRGRLSDSELKIFEAALAGTALEDGAGVIDDVAATGGYPPTAQYIAEHAEVWRKQRALARIENEKRQALPDGKQYMTFDYWLRNVATDEEKATVARVSPSLRKMFGGDLFDLDKVE
jgi:hypothetical protein